MINQCIQEMILYFDGDIRQINHALKVYGFAKTIAGGENVPHDEQTIVELSAILHDIGIPESMKKYGSSAGVHQEELGPPVAQGILEKLGCPHHVTKPVLFIIAHHHSYGANGELPLQIIFEADFLVNLDEGNLGSQTPKQIYERFFQTKTGKNIMRSVYGIKL